MKMRSLFVRLWRVDGTVDRVTYLSSGLIAFAIKHVLDWSIAHAFGKPWRLVNYWSLARASLAPGEVETLLIVALPFIWFGVTMTLLRARDAGVPAGTVVLFFVPVINLLYFAILAALPTADTANAPRTIPKSDSTMAVESAVLAVLITTTVGVAFVGISTWLFRNYGLMLFVGLPFVLGFLAAMVHGYRYPRSAPQIFLVATVSLLFVAGALLAIAWEGIICLVMAGPIALALAAFGAALGYMLQNSRRRTIAACVPLVLPFLFVADPPHPPLISVRTTIDINATPETVWRNVLTFSDIAEPPQWYFRTGIAYPLRTRIRGSGVGAVRYCIFSTGAFVEPIDVWDPPHRLAFGVTHSPAPMDELSPYASVRPPHLDGFFVSERGEFLLQRLPDGGTRLTGTTWYRNRLYPSSYWRIWSDAIIHRIHVRVLHHIRAISERN